MNDDILTRAFSRYPSFLKAKVVRDKRTGKTKGYGFVSFKDPNDYVRAMREMNGELSYDHIRIQLSLREYKKNACVLLSFNPRLLYIIIYCDSFVNVCPLLQQRFCTLAGKYVGSRPIKLRKSTWKDRNLEIVRKKQKEKKKLGLR